MNKVPVELPPLFEAAREAIANKTGSPDSFVFASILSAVSTAASAYRFNVYKHINAPALWICLVGESGTGKSPAIKEAYKPIWDYQYDVNEAEARAMREFKVKHKAWQSSVNKAMASGETNLPDEPIPPRHQHRVATDFTLEGLIKLHQGSSGLCVVADELASWLSSFSRYNSNSRATWLSLFDGDSVSQVRADESYSRQVRNPSVGVIGGIQLSKLSELKSGLEDGLSYRMIYFRDGNSKFKLLEYTEEDEEIASENSIEEYFKAIKNWLCYNRDIISDTLPIIKSSADAKKMLVEVINQGRQFYFDQERPGWSMQSQSMWSKMEIYIHRLAAVHFVMRCINDGFYDIRARLIQEDDVIWAYNLVHSYLIGASREIIECIDAAEDGEIRGAIPERVALYYSAIPSGEFEPFSKNMLLRAREAVPQWRSMSDASLKVTIRRILLSKSYDNMFTRTFCEKKRKYIYLRL